MSYALTSGCLCKSFLQGLGDKTKWLSPLTSLQKVRPRHNSMSAESPSREGFILQCRYSHSGVDLMRLNHARHAFATLICDTLHQAGATYSMPSISGPRHPGNLMSAAESSRPLTGSQVRASSSTAGNLIVLPHFHCELDTPIDPCFDSPFAT